MKHASTIVLVVGSFMLIVAANLAFFFYVDWANRSDLQLSLEMEQWLEQPSNLAESIASAKDLESIQSSCLRLAKYSDADSRLYRYSNHQSKQLFQGGMLLLLICFTICGSLLLFAYLTLRKALKNQAP